MKTPAPKRAFWRRVALHALWMHGVWEAVQCAFFYDMSGASILGGIAWMAGATLADVAITLLLVKIALRLGARNGELSRPRVAFWLIGFGVAIALLVEAGAQALGWWRYSPAMPIVSVFEWHIGALPLLQMGLLSCLAVYFERPFTFRSK